MTTAIVVGLGAVVALLAILVVGLLRAHAEVLRSLHDLGVTEDPAGHQLRRSPRPRSDDVPAFDDEDAGAWSPVGAGLGAAHDVTGTSPDGGAVHVGVTHTTHDTVLAFLSTGCVTCAAFWDALSMPGAEGSAGPDTRVVVVTKGPEDESETAVAELAPSAISTVMSTRAWVDYGIPASPFFLLVDGAAAKVVGEGTGQTWEQVLRLLQRSAADSQAAARRSRRELLTGGGRARPVADRIAPTPADDDVEVSP